MNKSRLLWISIAYLSALFALQATTEAGWKIKLGDKTIVGKEQKKNEQPAATPAAASAAPALICDSAATIHLCYAFSGAENAQDKVRKGNEMACKIMRGRFLASSTCSTSGALGKCTVQQGKPKEYTVFYYPGGRMNFTAASSEKDCKNPKSSFHVQGAGEWTAIHEGQ